MLQNFVSEMELLYSFALQVRKHQPQMDQILIKFEET